MTLIEQLEALLESVDTEIEYMEDKANYVSKDLRDRRDIVADYLEKERKAK